MRNDDDFDPEYMPDEPDVELTRCRLCGYYKPHLPVDDLCGGCHDVIYPPPPPPEDQTRD